MKRRNFISAGLSAGFLPVVMNGFSIKAFADNSLIQFLSQGNAEDRVLVLIQLTGGNDGLNTVIPLDQYSNLSALRSNVLIDQSKVLSMTGTQQTGLHPAMPELRAMYDNGKVSIVQSVGHPNPDFSHFRATDIWLTGSDADEFLITGWAGRYLETEYPGFPTGYPSTTFPDPPAIQIGALISPAFQGEDASLAMSITDPNSFYQFVTGTVDPAPNTPAGHELSFVRLVAQQTQQYSSSVKGAALNATNLSTLYPTAGTNSLSDQLKIVAQLIAGGLKTKVYMVSLGGFDTHSAQVVSGATETGSHASLLSKISVAVNAFQDDLEKLGIADRVLGMTFSEFGRRIISNASLGTDHGAAAPLFVFGNAVNPGLFGNNPIIPTAASGDDNIPMQFDYRSVYATILKNWFEVSDTVMNSTLFKSYDLIGFLSNPSTGLNNSSFIEESSVLAYPNPCQEYTMIRFKSNGGLTRIRIFDSKAQMLDTILETSLASGTQEVKFNCSHLPAGMYYFQIEQMNARVMRTLVIN